MDEAPGEPVRDRAFKARKREDNALALIGRLKESLADLGEVRSILREFGRYYDPVLGGAIMDVAGQRAIVEALEAGRQAEALLDRLLHHAHVLTCGPRSWRTRLQSDSHPS